MAWLRQLLDWQRETSDPDEFLDNLRFEVNSKEVYVFTPKGDIVSLPADSTPVDFAYAVHTEVGNRTIGARVNGALVSLDSTLSNGDVVELVDVNGIARARGVSAYDADDIAKMVGRSTSELPAELRRAVVHADDLVAI